MQGRHLTILSGHAPRRYCLALITTHAVQNAANLVTVAEVLLAPADDTRSPSAVSAAGASDTRSPSAVSAAGASDTRSPSAVSAAGASDTRSPSAVSAAAASDTRSPSPASVATASDTRSPSAASVSAATASDTPSTSAASVPAASDPGQLQPPAPRQLLDTTAYIWRNTRSHGLWSDLDRPLSCRRHVVWQEVPTRRLKETARAYDATSNDVHLAALAHAVSRWAAERRPDADRDALPMMLPVNLRTPTETGLPGNRFFLARLDLPGGPMTPARRLSRTLPATAPLKDPAYRRTLHRMTAQDPDQYGQLIARTAVPEGLTVVGSIFRIAERLSYEGDPVDRVVPIICCPDGFPLAVGLFLYGETSTASFQIDRALPGADSIPRLWRRALDDMATCAPGGDG